GMLDDRYVDVDRIAGVEHLVAREAVADLVVDRRGDGPGEGRVAGRRIAHGGRFHLQLVGQVFQAQTVELARRDARLDVRSNEIKDLRGGAAGRAHFVEVGGVGNYAHVWA